MFVLLFVALLYCQAGESDPREAHRNTDTNILEAFSEDDFGECGMRYAVNRHKPVISHGFEAEHSEYPWHVALYRQYSPTQEPEYICGGSIIQRDVIVTAAHCIYNESTFSLNKAVFTVVVGKYYRPWDHRESTEQKFKVIETRVPSTYMGILNRYADDIAILALNDSIKLSSTVMPVCVDWSSEFSTNISEVTGMVVGWGYTQSGSLSNELMVAKLNYFNFTTCRERGGIDGFISFVTSDKFCAGVDNGTAVERGDSGGGFVVPRNSTGNIVRYYLYGIVSTRDTWDISGAAFTDLNAHLSWIISTIESLKKLGYCTPLMSNAVELTNCSNNGTSVSCDEPSKRGTKANIRCKDGFHEGPPYRLHAETECFEDSQWTPVTDSCMACGIRYKGFTAEEKKRPEPWYVGIYKWSDEFHYICGGTLLHPNAVLTAAHCIHGKSNVSFYVVIGKYDCSWNTTEISEQRFKVSAVYIKPSYVGLTENYMDDIAILELNDTVKLSKYVMPACIDWSGTLKLYRNPLISGLSMGCDNIYRPDGVLKTHKLRFVNRRKCTEYEANLRPLTVDKLCATPDDGSADLGKGYCGGSFTFPKYNKHTGEEINYLYGIVSKATGDIVRLTDVMYHLKWITDILISKVIRT